MRYSVYCNLKPYVILHNFDRKIKVSMEPNSAFEGSEGSIHNHVGVNGPQTESKLELFGFDSLVNILGLKRYKMNYLLLILFVTILFHLFSI